MGKYDEIMGLEHHTSTTHRRMSALDRAAQFAPFAALTGYEDVLTETGRLTSERHELDESQVRRLDETFAAIVERLSEKPEVKVTWFEKDLRKAGGRYRTMEGRVRNIDFSEMLLVMTDETSIPVRDICDISAGPLAK